jgi:hypothetical protein
VYNYLAINHEQNRIIFGWNKGEVIEGKIEMGVKRTKAALAKSSLSDHPGCLFLCFHGLAVPHHQALFYASLAFPQKS